MYVHNYLLNVKEVWFLRTTSKVSETKIFLEVFSKLSSLSGGLEVKETQFSFLCIWQDPFSWLKQELGYNLEFQ